MRKILLLTMIIGFAQAKAVTPKDTTIIEFNDKTTNNRVKVITLKNIKDLPKILNLDGVLKSMGVDSSEREKAMVLITKDNKVGIRDTILAVTRDGQSIKIVTRGNSETKKDTIIFDTDTNTMSDEIITFEKEERNENFEKEERKKESPKKFFSKSDFGLYLGLNNFTNATPSIPNFQYDLRPLQSRYIAFSFRKNATISKGENLDVAISYGPEIAWYNFMLENSNVAVFENGKTTFVTNTKDTRKSKLVLPYLNLPVMLNFGLKEQKFKIGVGGYVGYRIGGYTSEKFISRGGKQKTQGNYGFNDLLYGLTAELGKRNGLTLFARYDLNNLFKASQTQLKDIQAFSVGIRI